jgi:hypothetical protein
MPNSDSYRERFLESNDRFQQAMLAAIRSQREGVMNFLDREDRLQESVEELKRLVLSNGEQIRDLGGEIRAFRNRLDG